MVSNSEIEIRTILIPVDGSEHAQKAALIGAVLAAKFNARVVLLHVLLRDTSVVKINELAEAHKIPKDVLEKYRPVTPSVYDFGLSIPAGAIGPVVTTELLIEVGRRILEATKADISGYGVKEIDLMMEDGDAAEKVIETAKDRKVDLVIMGHRGLGALGGMLAGSVSTKVGALVPSTVVSVK